MRRLIIDEAVSLAENLGEESLAYAGRLMLIGTAAELGDTKTLLSAFDWCLSRHMHDPATYPASIGAFDLLKEAAHIPETLARNAAASLQTISDEISALAHLFEAHTAGPSAMLNARLRVAQLTGQSAEVIEVRESLRTTVADRYSPCAVCRQYHRANEFVEAGRLGEAAAAFDVYFGSEPTCSSSLAEAYAHSMVVYLKTGHPAKAARSHQLGYELARASPRHLALIAGHLDYCTAVGDLTRGTMLLERHLPWLDADPLDSLAQFEALRAVTALCLALGAEGHCDRVIRCTEATRLPAYLKLDPMPRGELPVQVIGAECRRAANTLAVAFDRRNGNDAFSMRISAIPGDPARDRPAVRARRGVGLPLVDLSPASILELGRAAPSSRLWLQLARERASCDDVAAAESAARHAHDALDQEIQSAKASSASQHQHTRADLFALQITMATARGDDRRAESLLGLRADSLIADNRLDMAETELSLGLTLFGAKRSGVEHDLRVALEQVRRSSSASEVEVCIRNALASHLLRADEASEAAELLLRAVKLCGHDPENHYIQRSLTLLAHAQAGCGQIAASRLTTARLLRHDLDRATRAKALLLRAACSVESTQLYDGVIDADRALNLYRELGYARGIIDACAQLALLLEEVGLQVGVVEAWRQALHECERLNLADTTMVRFRLARALYSSGAAEEAAGCLESVLDQLVRSGASQTEIAEVLYWLGHAHRLADDDELAYCCWGVALSLTSNEATRRDAVRLGLALGRLLLDANDCDSIDVLTETVDAARKLGGPWELVDALHLLGQAQCEFEQSEGLFTLDEAIAVADEHAFDLDALVASITESRAHGLDALGREAEALHAARRSARLYERLGERSSAGLVRLFAARMLTGAERFDEAETEYRRSVELLAGDGAAAEAVARELRALTALESGAVAAVSV